MTASSAAMTMPLAAMVTTDDEGSCVRTKRDLRSVASAGRKDAVERDADRVCSSDAEERDAPLRIGGGEDVAPGEGAKDEVPSLQRERDEHRAAVERGHGVGGRREERQDVGHAGGRGARGRGGPRRTYPWSNRARPSRGGVAHGQSVLTGHVITISAKPARLAYGRPVEEPLVDGEARDHAPPVTKFFELAAAADGVHGAEVAARGERVEEPPFPCADGDRARHRLGVECVEQRVRQIGVAPFQVEDERGLGRQRPQQRREEQARPERARARQRSHRSGNGPPS